MSIRFINKESLDKKINDEKNTLFGNYPLFNKYDFKPTIRVLELDNEDITKVNEENVKEIKEENFDNTKIYI